MRGSERAGIRMSFLSVITWALLVLILMIMGSAAAEIPRKINYQGKLTDSATGEPEV